MDVSEIGQIGSESPPAAPTAAQYEQCGECGAAVDHDQRYCVSCGAHRRHVADPATHYLGRASANGRTGTTTGGSSSRRSRWTFGLAHALLLALIPAALAVGVVVGRSSNNDDANLIHALSHAQTQASVSAPARTTAAARAPRTRRKHGSRHASSTRGGGVTGVSFKHAQAPSSIDNPPTATQQRQGAAIVNKLQHTTGTSYLNQLPSQVSVP